MKTHVSLIGVMLVVSLTVAGCGGGKQAGTAQPGGGATINVAEKEWAIDLSQAQPKAGTYRFVIKNDGSIEHDFVIKGLNVRIEGIQPGQTKEVSVDLKPGTYTIICDIPGHEEAGMKTSVTVAQ